MKHLAVFILALAIETYAPAKACGPYYPVGDDVRFCLLRPELYEKHGMEDFRFSTSFRWEVPMQSVKYGEEVNVAWWRKRAASTLPDAVIHEAIYNSAKELKGTKFRNQFLLVLMAKGDKAAIDYLRFANSCSPANTFYADAWERKQSLTPASRRQLINEALKRAKTVKDPLSQRYAFLAIRMCYYNEDFETLNTTYATYFNDRTQKDIVDYWALYFRAITDKSYEKRNFDLAQVFAHAPDKRFVVTQKFRYTSITIEELLQMAHTDEEKSAVWLTYGIMEHGRARDNIENVYRLTPGSEELSSLLLREMNKLEDWILTPYYTSFGVPSEDHYLRDYPDYQDPYETRLKDYEKQLSDDRSYAAGLLKFLQACDPEKTADPLLWKTSIAYLQFMTGNHKAALAQTVKIAPEANPGTPQRDVIEQIGALCLVAKQANGKAVIPQEIEETLLNAYGKKNNLFLFAIARELEYKGNTTDAALLLSRDHPNGNGPVWRTPEGFNHSFFDCFFDYFTYLDATYTPEQVEALVQRTAEAKPGSPFSNWLMAEVKKDLPLLYDLLGTKKMRRNDFEGALSAFKQVDDTVWTSNYLPYEYWLDANPFYTTNYNEHTRTAADAVPYDKIKILEELLLHLRKAEDPSEPHRDYHYFLVANCELNMTFHGNSWLMKRYEWSNRERNYESGFEDDVNYYTCERAKTYYLKAKDVAKNKRFKALCVRMAGRCEKYRVLRDSERGKYDEYETLPNVYYDELAQNYPDEYYDLISSCESFDRYFASYKQ